MSYRLIIGDAEFEEPNKDEVIARLVSEWNARTGLALTVIWPDQSSIILDGFE